MESRGRPTGASHRDRVPYITNIRAPIINRTALNHPYTDDPGTASKSAIYHPSKSSTDTYILCILFIGIKYIVYWNSYAV